ncbi:MAG: multi-sensor hybrid histidine kinase [Acidobacteria bacterium]|nr:multi-sensor hybrid histidine kinase [Acidobacteriota bacterium]
MRDRFVLDRKENILFINFADLRIESREQVDEFAGMVREAVEEQGKRVYSIVNYEGTEIAPEIVEYYGERIKALQDRYAISTVRYSSSGLTRSVLRYLGAAVDLESNTFTTRDEAIRAIREKESRRAGRGTIAARTMLGLHRTLLGKLLLGWFVGLGLLAGIYFVVLLRVNDPGQLQMAHTLGAAVVIVWFLAASLCSAIVYFTVLRPIGQMDRLVRSLFISGPVEPIKTSSSDEVGELARVLNEAAMQLRRDIERLSGLYHISLMMGTSTEVSRICELLTRKVGRLLGAQMGVILLHDEPGNFLNAQLPAYGVSDDQVRLLRSDLNERNIATWVFKTGEPYLTNDVANDDLISRSAAELLGVSEILAVPLQAGERTLGTLEVMNKAGGFEEEDTRLLTIFASQAAQLLVSAQLFEQVRESEERYRQIFDSTLDGLFRSSAEGQLVTINVALATMLGFASAEDLVGASFVDDLFVDHAVGQHLMAELSRCGQVLDAECELRHRSGARLPARVSISVVKDKADQQFYHLGIVKDITEQKRLSEQLIISKQLAVVGELVAGVAHEVRNPLCGITATLSALARKLEDAHEVRPFIDVVMTEAHHLNELMEQLLEHSRPVQLDSHIEDIRDLLQEVLGEWKGQSESRQVVLELECPEPLPHLRLDRRKMHGVFANLIDNALQHTAPGGKVQIKLSRQFESSRAGAFSNLQIEVQDNGAGISPENLTRVFEPFFTTRSSGTGLGLAIVRKTVHDHGGAITVSSSPGKGAAFLINLPLEFNGHVQQQR